jgi:hypothetical protein
LDVDEEGERKKGLPERKEHTTALTYSSSCSIFSIPVLVGVRVLKIPE